MGGEIIISMIYNNLIRRDDVGWRRTLPDRVPDLPVLAFTNFCGATLKVSYASGSGPRLSGYSIFESGSFWQDRCAEGLAAEVSWMSLLW